MTEFLPICRTHPPNLSDRQTELFLICRCPLPYLSHGSSLSVAAMFPSRRLTGLQQIG